jgi:hypothetical protein
MAKSEIFSRVKEDHREWTGYAGGLPRWVLILWVYVALMLGNWRRIPLLVRVLCRLYVCTFVTDLIGR